MTPLSKKIWEGTAQFFVALAIFIFFPAGTLVYWQAWTYVAVFGISIIFINSYFLKHDPKLLQSRLNVGVTAEIEMSQKIIQGFASIFVILIIVISALDYRFHWSSVSSSGSIVADLIVAIGMYIVFLVFKENSFTSAIIETKKEQTVITTGPYSVVRHPMYSGALLAFFATPVGLGSWWAIVFSVLLTAILIIRVLDEEKYLTRNLQGYKEYLHKVHYRLIPFVW